MTHQDRLKCIAHKFTSNLLYLTNQGQHHIDAERKSQSPSMFPHQDRLIGSTYFTPKIILVTNQYQDNIHTESICILSKSTLQACLTCRAHLILPWILIEGSICFQSPSLCQIDAKNIQVFIFRYQMKVSKACIL